MAKPHRKMRNVTERYFRGGERQAAKIEPANLELSAMSCRNGRILTVKWTAAELLERLPLPDVLSLALPCKETTRKLGIPSITDLNELSHRRPPSYRKLSNIIYTSFEVNTYPLDSQQSNYPAYEMRHVRADIRLEVKSDSEFYVLSMRALALSIR